MTMKAFAHSFLDGYNAVLGSAVTVLVGIFGKYWYLLAAFLLFNLLDWLTGWYKAYKTKTESSGAGLTGIIKKLLYWVLVAVAFVVAGVMGRVANELLGVSTPWVYTLGWFTLACLFVNEARSIVENVVAAGVKGVPLFLTKGLAVTQKLLEDKAHSPFAQKEEEAGEAQNAGPQPQQPPGQDAAEEPTTIWRKKG